MFDPQTLSTALLAAVPEDGSSIGNQALQDQLKTQFAGLTEAQFMAASDALIEAGQLRKGRGRGGSVLRADGAGLNTENKASETKPAAMPAAKGKRGKQAQEVAPAETGIDTIKRTLWASADKLRANMDAAEYKHIVLGLIFIKYVSDTFQARRGELEHRFTDESDDYYLHDADAEFLAEELEERDYYREVNVFWVPEGARWEVLLANAKQADIGKRIDDALVLIEQENQRLKGILDKRLARAQLPDGKLGELVDLVSTIGFGDEPGAARDVLGQVYDPCCGSGGMFVQSEKFIEAHGGKLGDVSIYGQESNRTTWRLAAMNLAIRGMDYNLGKELGDTLLPRLIPGQLCLPEAEAMVREVQE
ncbi:type I restriction-modification system subunit M [Aeromonas dhakensis]|uniref:type I restriction-modification system subunit M n=1 Tax=Aeromonas dhakensis TaxID=196024 RepID=UPI0038CF9EBF